MLELMTDKAEIVRTLIPFIPEEEISDFDYCMKTWWKNIRSTGGLGLTYYGDCMFQLMELENYTFEIGISHGSMSNLGTAMYLDKYIKCPYYFLSKNNKRVLHVYDSRIATMIMLTGDVFEYMNKLKKRQENTDD
jgi:hypothetical protein